MQKSIIILSLLLSLSLAQDYSLSFDGVDDYISTPTIDLTGTSFTIEMWYKTDSVNFSDQVNLIDNYLFGGSPGTNRWGVYLEGTSQTYTTIGKISFLPPTGGNHLSSSIRVDDNEWHHIAVVRYEDSITKLFIDGIVNDTGSSSIDSDYNAGYDILIGSGHIGRFNECSIREIMVNADAIYSSNFEPVESFNTHSDALLHLSFNEGTGNVAIDQSGNQNDGTIYGGATWVENIEGCTDSVADNFDETATVDDGSCTGYPYNGDYSLSFDGEGDYIDLGDLTWGGMPSGAISGFFVDNGDDGMRYIVGENSYSNGGALGIRVGGNSIWATNNNNNGNNCVIEGGNVQQGVGYQFLMTWDSSIGSLIFYLYSDNQLQILTSPSSGNCDFPTPFSNSVDRIGKGWDGSTWNGTIDDIALWDIYIEGSLVEDYFQSNFIGTENNLRGLWKFNAGSGTTLYDHSGNGNHGTINSFSII